MPNIGTTCLHAQQSAPLEERFDRRKLPSDLQARLSQGQLRRVFCPQKFVKLIKAHAENRTTLLYPGADFFQCTRFEFAHAHPTPFSLPQQTRLAQNANVLADRLLGHIKSSDEVGATGMIPG